SASVGIQHPDYANLTARGVRVDREDIDFVMVRKTVAETVEDKKEEPQGVTTLIGNVVDSRTGNPLSEFTVTGPEGLKTARTDRPGQFRIEDLVVGRYYTFTIEATGYAPLRTGLEPMAAGAEMIERTFRVSPAKEIVGRVVYAGDHSPMTGIRVELKKWTWERNIWQRPPDEITFTGADGRFRLSRATTGENSVLILPSSPLRKVLRQIRVNEGERTDLGDVALDEGGRIAGRLVRRSTDKGVGGARVELQEENSGLAAQATQTDQNGGFDLSALPRLSYLLRFPEYGLMKPVDLTGADTQQFVLYLESGIFKGRVVRRSQPVRARISLVAEADGASRVKETNEAGSFEFTDLPLGPCSVVVETQQPEDRLKDTVNIAAGASLEELYEFPGGRIVGTVVNEKGQLASEAVVYARIVVFGGSEASSPPSLQAISDMEGKFAFEGLTKGVYAVSAVKPGVGRAYEGEVTVPLDEDSQKVVLRLGERGGGLEVAVRESGSRRPPYYFDCTIFVRTDRHFSPPPVRDNGTVRYASLPAGSYVVEVSANGYTTYRERIVVSEGETTRLEVELRKSGSSPGP
ncbi:MAG: carboxypeptidase regulatory-like domain-containing protein, partial [bacterium]